MIRKVLSLAMFLVGIFSVSAQMPELPQLPIDPKVKTGVLSNGLTYFIMHNEEPKNRANFYIAQKVGSSLENQDQLGLAHFLEHMAFNGTSHYPGKDMLNYLQGKGIRFGADINAYTGFDETVYNINNVPTTDKALMDSVLLVLHDWSGEILLEEAEIDAERGVIQEEWRSRNDATTRMYSAMLPVIFKEYQYQQMPIGTMDVVLNFKPEVLRAYYHKWYRPDLQGIVIVGDFDADEMEKKVKDLFSSIPKAKNPAKREYPSVSDNKEPIYFSFSDPELSAARTTISFKSDGIPLEYRNTEVYMQQDMLMTIICALINNRLTDFAQTAECDYSYAGVYFGQYYVSKTKDSFNVITLPKKGKTQEAVADAMGIVARGCKTGFTDTELERVFTEILANLENSYNERDKTSNDSFGKALCGHFTDNVPHLGIEKEYEIWKQSIPMINVQVINQIVPQLLSSENMVVVTTEPKQDGFEIVAEDVMVKTINDAMNAEYEAYVDEVITDPLIAQLPAPGKITNMSEDAKLGTITYTLSNGIKVVLKPTDFAADEVIMTAFREGGKRIYAADQAANVLMMDDAYGCSKMGPFDRKTLNKYLAGKKANVSFSVNNYTDVLNGYSTVKDLTTLMELVYTSFTALTADQETYDVEISRALPMLESQAKDPQTIFFRQVAKTRYEDNPLMMSADYNTVKAAKYSEALELVHDSLKNAAEYTFIFTGNVDNATIRPLLEQYIATLPVGLRKKMKVVTPIDQPSGNVDNVFKQPMQAPATHVFDVYVDNNLPFNAANDAKVSLLGDVLGNVFTETLREEEGGTYSPSASAGMNPNTGEWNIVYYFITNADQQEKLIGRAHDELIKLLQNGTNEANFNKVKEAAIKQLEIAERNNRYWDSMIMSYLRGFDYITGSREALENLTLAEFNEFMKNLYNGKNRIQVVMEGVAAE